MSTIDPVSPNELRSLADLSSGLGVTIGETSFRDGPKDQTRNLEIPGSMLRIAPE